MCLTVGRQSRDHRPLSRDPSVSFYKKFPNCLKRRKNGVWQSADGRVTSDHCRMTVQRLFSNFFLIACNVQKTLFDSRPTVAWPQPLSRDRSATFFEIFPNCLKRPKNIVWQSADGRVTSDHCRVTVQRLFSKFSQIAWNFQKTLFDSRPTVAWPQPLSRDRSATFFKIFPNRLKRPKNVVWQSADSRVTSDHCHVTVQRLFSKKILIAWNVQKTFVWQSADGRVTSTTVAWPFSDFFRNFPKSLETSKKRCLTVGRGSRDLRPVAWPFSDFFQNFPKSLETSKKRCLTVGRRSRDLRSLSRDRSATFFQKISNCLKRRKIVVWQSADSRVTSDHCHVTVQRLFSKKFLIAWNVEKSLFDSRPMVAWPPTTLARHHILPRRCISRLLFVYFYFRQCRNYVANEMIRLKAEFLYSKFKGLFLVGDDADFYNQVRIRGNTELKIDVTGSLLHRSTDLVQHVKPAAWDCWPSLRNIWKLFYHFFSMMAMVSSK